MPVHCFFTPSHGKKCGFKGISSSTMGTSTILCAQSRFAPVSRCWYHADTKQGSGVKTNNLQATFCLSRVTPRTGEIGCKWAVRQLFAGFQERIFGCTTDECVFGLSLVLFLSAALEGFSSLSPLPLPIARWHLLRRRLRCTSPCVEAVKSSVSRAKMAERSRTQLRERSCSC